MKKLMTLLIFAGLAVGAYAEEEKEGLEAAVGAGIMAEKSPFQGVGTEVTPIPIVDLSYGDLYFRGTELGYEVWEKDKFAVDVFLAALEGYEVEGGDLDKGYQKIDDRDAQIEGGLSISYKLPEDFELTARIALGSEGNRYTLEGGKLYFVGEKTIIKPALYATFNDSGFTDYYFGVSEKETNRAGNEKIGGAYDPGSSQSFGFEMMVEHGMSESLTIVGMGGMEYLSSEVKDSPIVEDNFIYEVGLGLKYRF